MQKVTLSQLKRYSQDKNGNQLKTKDGRPYTRLNIKTVQYGEKWLSGFDNSQTKAWQEGDDVEIDVKENGEYLNFSVPKPVVMAQGSFTEKDREKLEMIHVLLLKLDANLQKALTVPELPSIGIDDMPFPPEEEN